MAKLPAKFLTTGEAAYELGYSVGYLAYMRTPTAKKRGHIGPPYIRVDMRDGSHQPRRIRYDRDAILKWYEDRQALFAAARPIIQHVAG